jgi:hypothetical protein
MQAGAIDLGLQVTPVTKQLLPSHHAEGLVNPKVHELKKGVLISDTPEHVDSENIKF